MLPRSSHLVRGLDRSVRNFGWPVADQACSSLGNFSLAVMMAHTVTPRVFGLFALMFSGYLVALNICRSFLTTPLLLSGARREWEGAAILGSAVLGMVAMAASMAVGADELPLIMAIGLPGLLVLDSARFVLVGREQPQHAAMLSATFTLAALLGFWLLHLTHSREAAAHLILWVLAGYAASTLGWIRIRPPVSVGSLLRFLDREHRRGLHLLGENLAVSAYTPLSYWIVGSLAPLELVAGLQAASSNILGGINILVQGLQPQILVSLRSYSGDSRRLIGYVLSGGTLLLSLTLAGAVLVLMLPDAVGRALGGHSFELSRPLLLATAVWMGLNGLADIARACVRPYRSAAHMRNMRMLTVGFSLAAIAVGVGRAGMTGLIPALVAVSAGTAIVAVVDLGRALSSRHAGG